MKSETRGLSALIRSLPIVYQFNTVICYEQLLFKTTDELLNKDTLVWLLLCIIFEHIAPQLGGYHHPLTCDILSGHVAVHTRHGEQRLIAGIPLLHPQVLRDQHGSSILLQIVHL